MSRRQNKSSRSNFLRKAFAIAIAFLFILNTLGLSGVTSFAEESGNDDNQATQAEDTHSENNEIGGGGDR